METRQVTWCQGGGWGHYRALLSSYRHKTVSVNRPWRTPAVHSSRTAIQATWLRVGVVDGDEAGHVVPGRGVGSLPCSTQQLPAQDRFRKPPLANSSSAFFPHCNPSNLNPHRRRRLRRGRSRGARAGGAWLLLWSENYCHIKKRLIATKSSVDYAIIWQLEAQ